jgi:hypothetical protein
MPEIKNKNMVEQTRDEIHREDNESFDDNDESRELYHNEDVKQVTALTKELQDHCANQKVRERLQDARDRLIDERDAKTEEKLDKLLPIVDLVPSIQTLIEEKRMYTIYAAKVLKAIGITGAVIGLLAGALAVIKYWKDIK